MNHHDACSLAMVCFIEPPRRGTDYLVCFCHLKPHREGGIPTMIARVDSLWTRGISTPPTGTPYCYCIPHPWKARSGGDGGRGAGGGRGQGRPHSIDYLIPLTEVGADIPYLPFPRASYLPYSILVQYHARDGVGRKNPTSGT